MFDEAQQIIYSLDRFNRPEFNIVKRAITSVYEQGRYLCAEEVYRTAVSALHEALGGTYGFVTEAEEADLREALKIIEKYTEVI